MLDLQKSKEALKLSLEKRGVASVPSADLAFVLDVSGSFGGYHGDGTTQKLLERLVPWGMLFDPDQKLDVFTFSDGSSHAHYVGDITPQTVDGYIQNSIARQVPGYNGGTDYSYVLEKVLKHFGWLKQGGLMGMFGGAKEKKRSIVLFVTDGSSGDESHCQKVLQESEARKDEVYFLFIGIGGPFPFLEKIGDRFSNTGLAVIKNLNAFVQMTDEQVNDLLIGEELITWLKK
jgi:hypothetical protein